MKRMLLSNTWRGEEDEDCQIGQLLYYMLGSILQHIQRVMAPTTATAPAPPAPLLGIYMEEGVVCVYVDL